MYNLDFKLLIKNIISNKWKKNDKILYLSLILCYSLIAYYILKSGYSISSDSERYSRWADNLINLNFNFYEFFSIEKASHRPSLFFFSVPVLLIALCKVVFLAEWQFSFLILNLIFVFFSLIIFVKCLLLIEVRSILISITLPIILISVDILTWPKFILSDMIYAFLVLYAVYFIIKVIVNNKINYLELFIIIFLLFASRPSSIPVVFAILSFITILKLQIILSKKKILLIILFIIFSTPLILGMVYSFIEFKFNYIAKVDFLTEMVKNGIIVHDRPETWVDTPNNFIDVVYIYSLRLVNFFNPYAKTFSILHIVFNVFQMFIILLSIFIWVLLRDYTKSQNKIYFFIIMLSLIVAAFHSFILIDFDWRYRFPILLPLTILFPISMEHVFKKYSF